MPVTSFRNGEVVATMDHTPVAAVDAGDVVDVGNILCVAAVDIPANQLGSLNVFGGVYRGIADGAIAAGVRVYFNLTTEKFTLTAAGNQVFGVSVSATLANGDEIRVFHNPTIGIT